MDRNIILRCWKKERAMAKIYLFFWVGEEHRHMNFSFNNFFSKENDIPFFHIAKCFFRHN